MASIVHIPFNFAPVNTGTVLNGSYTVPAGKYARVTVNLSVMARVSSTTLVLDGGESIAISNNSDSLSAVFWLKSGEAMTSSVSPASGSSHSTSSAYVSIDGVEAARVFAAVSGAIFATGGNDSLSLSGEAKASIRYEEYNNIS